MFLRDEDGHNRLENMCTTGLASSYVRLPNFTDKLTLRSPYDKDGIPAYMKPQLAAQLREHLVSKRACYFHYFSYERTVDDSADTWLWSAVSSGYAILYAGRVRDNNKRFSPWAEQRSEDIDDKD
ncbi:hypothetical protein F5B21DRAFT_364519 [Xylaria acuta]|nr:hypothetical protein F5B21DRAFT_364519 [Xylaria acuta]